MKLPLEVTFRHMEPSAAMESNIRDRAAKLDRFYDRIMSCRVMVEARHRHSNKGNIYHVRIDLTVPDSELAISRDPPKHQAHEDAYVAIRDAFDAARRQLQAYSAKRRGDTKFHEAPATGRVSELVPAEDYGVIETLDGREIYFHRNSVLNAELDQLKVGAEVRFDEEEGEKGPQATTVKVVGKHHFMA